MYRTVLIRVFAAVLGLDVTAPPLFALPVAHGAMDICWFDGGTVTIKDGAEVCCAYENGNQDDGVPNGQFYCVQCDPPGSNNCEKFNASRAPGDRVVNLLLAGIRAEQQGILAEQQGIRSGLSQVLTGLDNLLTRIDDVQAACAPADLLPVALPGSAPPDFCKRDGLGNLLVRVKNQGLTEAPASTLRVTFSTPSGPVSANVSTPALAGGGGLIDLAIPIPGDCSRAGTSSSACDF